MLTAAVAVLRLCRSAYRRRRDVRAVTQLLHDCRSAVWLAALIGLESRARGLGVLDGLLAPDRHIRWRIARSARVLASEASPVKDPLASRSRMA